MSNDIKKGIEVIDISRAQIPENEDGLDQHTGVHCNSNNEFTNIKIDKNKLKEIKNTIDKMAIGAALTATLLAALTAYQCKKGEQAIIASLSGHVDDDKIKGQHSYENGDGLLTWYTTNEDGHQAPTDPGTVAYNVDRSFDNDIYVVYRYIYAKKLNKEAANLTYHTDEEYSYANISFQEKIAAELLASQGKFITEEKTQGKSK